MYESVNNTDFALKQLQSVTAAVISGGGAAVAALGTLTITTNPAADGETVTVGESTYTFVAALTGVPGQVVIGGTTTVSATNLAAAINAGAGAGSLYSASTKANQSVTASPSTNTVVVTSRTLGAAGNAIVTTETMADGAWGGGTLASGAGDLTVTGLPADAALESVVMFAAGVPSVVTAEISDAAKIATLTDTTGNTLLVRWLPRAVALG